MRDDIRKRIVQIKRGEVPEGYKKTKVGIVPEEWEVISFNKIAKVRSGLVNPQNEPYSDMLSVGSENIEKGTGRIINLKTAKEQNNISGKYYFNKNTIIYSKVRPNLNKVCIPDFDGICSADCYVIDGIDTNITVYYLFVYMMSLLFYKQAVSCSMRTKMPKINQDELSTFLVVKPSIYEQRKIENIFKQYDQRIVLNEQVIVEKQNQKKYLMQNLLTGKKRLKGFDGEWKNVKLGDLFSERNEINNTDCELLSITADGIKPRSELAGKDNSSKDKSKYKKIYVGDIGYNTMRMWQGVSAYSDYEGIVSPAYTVLKNKKDIDVKFFAYLFKLPACVFTFYRYSQGLVDDTRNLKYTNFKKIKLNVPTDVKEQHAIATILTQADREIELLQEQLEQMKLEKKAMMQLLLTGIVRV